VPIAALVAGAADPYDLSPADMLGVKSALERRRPLVRFYWSDTTVVEEALATGEIVVAAT